MWKNVETSEKEKEDSNMLKKQVLALSLAVCMAFSPVLEVNATTVSEQTTDVSNDGGGNNCIWKQC